MLLCDIAALLLFMECYGLLGLIGLIVGLMGLIGLRCFTDDGHLMGGCNAHNYKEFLLFCFLL